MRKESLIALIVTAILFLSASTFVLDIPLGIKLPEILTGNTLFGSSVEDNLTKEKTKVKLSTTKKKSIKPKVVDQLNGVNIYFNGSVSNIYGRAVTKDGYNLGLKYQCVEFVKRYYYEHLQHKMPNSYGHAKEFFDQNLTNGQYNSSRGLWQFKNKTFEKPKVNDILIFSGNQFNAFGHVAIVSKVTNSTIEITQQNPGPKNKSRAIIPLLNFDGIWELRGADILGWLRKA